ncbi:MAG: indole-3-glycerol phosphate synthase TrpC [Clostridiales bacterium]|nr:indole-3-glycerol phosphate synthase TrpC [Clostridiales bacterium]
MSILEAIIARVKDEEGQNFNAFFALTFPLRQREKTIDILTSLNNQFFVIAEVKKKSPSKGILRENFDPVNLALAYEKAGASAISVVTEKHFFSGEKEYLTRIKSHTSLPVMRKDFLIHPYQVFESYNLGADFVLLIVACLSREELKAMIDAVEFLGLQAMVEVHTQEELEKALSLNPKIIGINNRDLLTFEVDVETSFRLKKLIPEGIHVISESGLDSPEQVRKLRDAGFSGVLVGEYFLKANDIARAMKELCCG